MYTLLSYFIGGGGTTPGIGGGAGGGSSYVFLPRAYDHLTILGHGRLPGGIEHSPPEAIGLGYVAIISCL